MAVGGETGHARFHVVHELDERRSVHLGPALAAGFVAQLLQLLIAHLLLLALCKVMVQKRIEAREFVQDGGGRTPLALAAAILRCKSETEP